MRDPRLQKRFVDHLRSLGMGERPLHLLVGFSGGLDSTVLLHLLRFRCGELRLTLTAAHLDHRMRPSSGADAEWARGVCLDWGIPLDSGSATRALTSEGEAREERYRFLRAAAARAGAQRIVTAHHADDQAETVLFRILRGTGLSGLGGIPSRTRSGLLRPLLPFWRDELEAYARAESLVWREDPTNATHGPTRNRIRLELLPLIEREIAPGARRHLVSLAALARESEAGWRSVARPFLERCVREEGGATLLGRRELRRYPPALRARIVREVLRRRGVVLDRAGTRSLLQFITDAPSGREKQLPGGVRVHLEFECARIESAGELLEDLPLEIEEVALDAGFAGVVRVGGEEYSVAARLLPPAEADPPGDPWKAVIPAGDLAFPLRLRRRQPGDRIATPGGTKSLKKLMIERRIPRLERSRRPVLVDAAGNVLWVAGVTLARASAPTGPILELAVTKDE
jgi:tRNA(Ile)-lysidine synthase